MENRIDITFRSAQAHGKIVLAPFITVGFPSVAKSEAIASAVLNSGADIIELGVPFSDPLAEGTTIQKTSNIALNQGVTVDTCLKLAKRLRDQGIESPIILMGYLNPYFHLGLTEFVKKASASGVDGLIIPDLPSEEAGDFRELCNRTNLYLIPLLAPTSTEERILQACKRANGFIYCVSLTGVTGARNDLSKDLPELVAKIRKHTDLPIMIGFGVSNYEHIKAIGQIAEGAVVGSALLDAIDKAPDDCTVETAGGFVKGLLQRTN